jgi:hypothetical protein
MKNRDKLPGFSPTTFAEKLRSLKRRVKKLSEIRKPELQNSIEIRYV